MKTNLNGKNTRRSGLHNKPVRVSIHSLQKEQFAFFHLRNFKHSYKNILEKFCLAFFTLISWYKIFKFFQINFSFSTGKKECLRAAQDQHLNHYVLSWTEVILFKYNNFQIRALTSPHVVSKINWAYAVFSQVSHCGTSLFAPEEDWQSQ